MYKKILLSVAVIAILGVPYANAEELSVITVTTATKTKKNIDGIAASVEVLTQKDIEKIGGESLKNIINRIPGVHMQHSGGAASSGQPKSAISMRGISSKGTLTLIDGRRIATEFKKSYELNRIPASQIERIEVIKGPMSTLYGSDASGGVVNIITKKPKEGKTDIDFGVRYGQNGDGDAQNKNINLGVRSSLGTARYSIYANHTETEPYTQKERADVYVFSKKKSNMKKPSKNGKTKNKVSDFYDEDITFRDASQVTTYGARVTYDVKEGTTVGFEFNAFDEHREGTYLAAFSKSKYKNKKGKPIKLTNVPIHSKEDNQKLDMSVDVTSQVNDDVMVTLRAYTSKYEKLSTSTSTKWKELGFKNEQQTYKKKMEVVADFATYEGVLNYALNERHLLTLGAEYRQEDWDSFVFPGGIKQVKYKSAYLQDEWEIHETLNAILGVRYDDISGADNKTTMKLGVVKNFSKLLNLRVNFAQGYRAPDTKELYVYRTTTKGVQRGAATVDVDIGKKDSNLKPEFTNAYELGLSGRDSKFSYSAVLFFNQIDNQISTVRKKQYFTYENISEAETKGFEFSSKYDILNNLTTGFSWTELRTEDKKTGKELQFQPERIVSVNLDYQVNNDFSMGMIVKHVGEQYMQEVVYAGTPKQSKKDSIIDSYTSLDLTTLFQADKNLELYGGIDNLLDGDVDDALGSTVGRYYYVGARIKF